VESGCSTAAVWFIRRDPSYTEMMRAHRHGFTVIELLAVITIISILSGMVMSMMSTAQRTAKRTSTQSVMRKVDTAIRLFKSDFRVYPYQLSYPNLGAGQSWTNRLYYQVGTDISTSVTPSDADRVLQDMDTAAAQFSFDCRSPTATNWTPNDVKVLPAVNGAKPHVFRAVRAHPNNSGVATLDSDVIGTCVVLNRMAAERARLIVQSGNYRIGGVVTPDIRIGAYFQAGTDLSGQLLVPAAASAAKPGWAVDYLQGELEKRYISGDQILDSFGRPLIYICQVLPGVRPSLTLVFGNYQLCRSPEIYGLATIGRKMLTHETPVPAPPVDPDFPDRTNLMHSNITTYAAPGFEIEFELWSAGLDGKFAYMRDDPKNFDNISCHNYLKGLRQ
jgi:prepilin-type N-terminal cleavage/methylation domain-containing protein